MTTKLHYSRTSCSRSNILYRFSFKLVLLLILYLQYLVLYEIMSENLQVSKQVQQDLIFYPTKKKAEVQIILVINFKDNSQWNVLRDTRQQHVLYSIKFHIIYRKNKIQRQNNFHTTYSYSLTALAYVMHFYRVSHSTFWTVMSKNSQTLPNSTFFLIPAVMLHHSVLMLKM